MIYVVMEIYLLYPYAKSIGVLFDMANIWNMKVIQSNTNNEKAIISIPEDKFRIALHIHKLHCRKDIENYWLKITKISRGQFYKTQIKPTSLGQRKNKLYNGTCAIGIQSRDLFRRIKGWKLGFLGKINS